MLVLVIGNVRNFLIVMQESITVCVYSVDCLSLFITRSSHNLRLKKWCNSATLLSKKHSSRHGWVTKSCARHGLREIVWRKP